MKYIIVFYAHKVANHAYQVTLVHLVSMDINYQINNV